MLGVVAVVMAGAGVGADDGETAASGSRAAAPAGNETAADADGEAADCFRDVPPEGLRTLEAGAQNAILVRPDQPKAGTLWLRLTDGGEPLGGLRYRFHPENELFKIERLVGAGCEPLEPVEDVGRGGDPRVLQNSDTVRLRFGEALYDLRLIASSDIRANFVRYRE